MVYKIKFMFEEDGIEREELYWGDDEKNAERECRYDWDTEDEKIVILSMEEAVGDEYQY